ncbi:MAG: hypothetical protein GYA15_00880 [Leptolinea sp.]|jgi:hypothetical protein|nr:hypothetical protein [Leptolinea sp.]
MPDQIRNKLGAYLDGELNRYEQTEVENHLQTCPACREELEELRRLSSMLRSDPQPAFTSLPEFKAQIMLQLPRKEEPFRQQSNGQMTLWLAPVLMVVMMIFMRVTDNLSAVVSLLHQIGLLDGSAGWASGTPQQTFWYSALQLALGGSVNTPGLTGLQVLNTAGVLSQNIFILLLSQVGTALLYWGVLTLVWRKRAGTFLS